MFGAYNDNEPIPLDNGLDTVSESEESIIEEDSPKNISVGYFAVVKFDAGNHCHHFVGLIGKVGGNNKEYEARF